MSMYYCANCGKISGMYGHYISSSSGFSCEKVPENLWDWGNLSSYGFDVPVDIPVMYYTGEEKETAPQQG